MQPCGAATCAVLRQALGSPRIKITIGDQRSIERNAHLAAMSMACHDQIVPVVRHGVDHPTVGRMGDADRDVDLLAIYGPGDVGVMILVQVSVVSPSKAEPYAFDLKRRTGVSQVDPPRLLETSSKILPGQSPRRTMIAPARTFEIAQRILELRGVVVVRPPDVDTRTIKQATEARKHDRYGIFMREVVAGVDHQVRLSCAQCR